MAMNIPGADQTVRRFLHEDYRAAFGAQEDHLATETAPAHEGTTTIHCEDCGHAYETIRRNTKYCAVCRLFRDIMFIGTKKSKCLVCDANFCKTARNDLLCADCDVIGSRLHGHGDCALCGATEAKLIRIGIAVCLGCAKSPERRPVFLKALARKVGERREVSNG